MSEPTAPEAPPSSEGRQANGQFAKGNQFGPGNPFARKCAAFRAALMDAVTDQDIKDIAVKLRDDAKAGDKAAIKLLFQYVIGKPQPAVDPDTLDVQEMRGYVAAAFPPEVLEEMKRSVPLPLMLQIWPLFLFAKEQANIELAQKRNDQQDEKQRRRAERAQRKAERRQRRQEARQAQPKSPAIVPSPEENHSQAAAATTEAPPSANPAMWVEKVSEQDGVSPGSPRGDFLREQREEIDAGHRVGLGRWATSPSRQRGI
jgi:hypothetical protein